MTAIPNTKRRGAIHGMEGQNPHSHVMSTMRRVHPQAMEFEAGSPCALEPIKARDQSDWGYMDHWRETWADHVNAAMARHGLDARIDHRTLIEQGITDREPGIHIGPTANAMEARGVATGRWLKNAWIWFGNEEPWFEENRRYLAFLEAEAAEERRREIEEAAKQEQEKEIDAAAAIVGRADDFADLARRLDEAAHDVVGNYAVRLYGAAEELETQCRAAVEGPELRLRGLTTRLSLARPNAQMPRKRFEAAAARLDHGIEAVLARRTHPLQVLAMRLDRAHPTFAVNVAAARSRLVDVKAARRRSRWSPGGAPPCPSAWKKPYLRLASSMAAAHLASAA